ncbi:hypothetical protein HPB52_005079 [Rhipicephalus sanguineus]|uniref:THAP-type domain-containing protein n=1 Tax=Rhipicephalus sanguineus TaxID=34632 RepID=A0A9D4PE50_RHISA|nr:hypothetical protein HPB52_005079 [Rhipicephalus sanguineus]
MCHSFPKDKTLRDAWQRAVRRDGWTPKDADVLCSEHFEAGCFDRTGQTTRLRQGSIPTVFPAFPVHLQKPRLISGATCSCKAGSDGACKHVAAVALELNNLADATSSTDVPQQESRLSGM